MKMNRNNKRKTHELFSIVFHIIIMVTSHHQHIFIELLFMLRLMINALTIRYVVVISPQYIFMKFK